MALPDSPNGYAVNLATREIHKRHAPHARNLRRTTAGGLAGLLRGEKPIPCKDCFPPKASKTSKSSEPEKPAGLSYARLNEKPDGER